MPNRAVELHDTDVQAITMDAASCVIDLHAYVHESEGQPGVDPGTGWMQPMRLTLARATILSKPDRVPLWVLRGSVSVDDQLFDNLLPLPFRADGVGLLRCSGAEGTLEVRGEGVELLDTGEAVFVERFPGSGG